uniref:hypothetical protein n=1 Tax=Paraburkholderia rhizosphaerae TaxID=480658 RepID=UPI00366D7B57
MRRRRVLIGAPAAPFGVAHAGQTEPKRRIGPADRTRPPKTEQPGQTCREQHEHRERRADAAEQMAEAACERMTGMIEAGDIEQRRFDRATRDHHADEAEPQTDRARSTQAGTARQCGFHEAPEEREQPDS